MHIVLCFFLTEDHADQFDSDINPAYICQNSSVICNFYDFDEDLMNAVARKLRFFTTKKAVGVILTPFLFLIQVFSILLLRHSDQT